MGSGATKLLVADVDTVRPVGRARPRARAPDACACPAACERCFVAVPGVYVRSLSLPSSYAQLSRRIVRVLHAEERDVQYGIDLHLAPDVGALSPAVLAQGEHVLRELCAVAQRLDVRLDFARLPRSDPCTRSLRAGQACADAYELCPASGAAQRAAWRVHRRLPPRGERRGLP